QRVSAIRRRVMIPSGHMSTSGPRAVTKPVIAVPPAPIPLANPAEEAEAFVQLVAAGGPKRCPACGTHYPVDFLVCPKDATSLQTDAPDVDALLGMVLGDTYQIHRMVGEGGMARVYEARHLRLPERRIAVKILHPEFARDTEVIQRFQRE